MMSEDKCWNCKRYDIEIMDMRPHPDFDFIEKVYVCGWCNGLGDQQYYKAGTGVDPKTFYNDVEEEDDE
tara:strand:+ start:1043 stop:1249 length:207 start_codon:yes stop_codon:yes gene_type:complete